jgi:outer membrane protein insertion porin family
MLKRLLKRFLHSALVSAAVFGLAARECGATDAENVNRDSLVLSQDDLYGKPVKEIAIVGAKRTKEYVIRRELISRVDQPYLETNAKLDIEKLTRLGIFSVVKVHGRASGGGVILTIYVVETFSILPVVSIAISDENGVSVGGGLKMLNLGGRATYLSAVASFGGANSLQFTLKNPWVAGNHLSYNVHFFHYERTNKIFSFNETSNEAYAEIQSYVRKNGRIGGRLMLETLHSDEPGKTLSADDMDNVASLGAYAIYDTRDEWNNPNSGWLGEMAVWQNGIFGTDSDFWRLIVDLRRYNPLSAKSTLCVFSMATLTTGAVGTDVAEWQQFGIGGVNTIRGCDLGGVIGKNQFINTLEYRRTLLAQQGIRVFGVNLPFGMQGTVFGDFGSAWSENEDFKPSFILGYGVGLRFILPYVDAARIELAAGQEGEGIKVLVATGEKADRARWRIR